MQNPDLYLATLWSQTCRKNAFFYLFSSGNLRFVFWFLPAYQFLLNSFFRNVWTIGGADLPRIFTPARRPV